MTVVSAFLIIEQRAENVLFENWRPAILKKLGRTLYAQFRMDIFSVIPGYCSADN